MSEELIKQQEAKIEELNNEIAALKLKAEEDKTAGAVRDAAAASQRTPAAVPSPALQDVQRERVIKSVGGKAHYCSLSRDARLAANGQPPASQEECDLSVRLFGKNSSSLEAARAYKSNPARYQRLKTIFREL